MSAAINRRDLVLLQRGSVKKPGFHMQYCTTYDKYQDRKILDEFS